MEMESALFLVFENRFQMIQFFSVKLLDENIAKLIAVIRLMESLGK